MPRTGIAACDGIAAVCAFHWSFDEAMTQGEAEGVWEHLRKTMLRNGSPYKFGDVYSSTAFEAPAVWVQNVAFELMFLNSALRLEFMEFDGVPNNVFGLTCLSSRIAASTSKDRLREIEQLFKVSDQVVAPTPRELSENNAATEIELAFLFEHLSGREPQIESVSRSTDAPEVAQAKASEPGKTVGEMVFEIRDPLGDDPMPWPDVVDAMQGKGWQRKKTFFSDAMNEYAKAERIEIPRAKTGPRRKK